MKSDNPYRKELPTNTIDIYRILREYNVTDPCIQHIVKKLLCAGQRGAKGYDQDIKEAFITFERYYEMNAEEGLF